MSRQSAPWMLLGFLFSLTELCRAVCYFPSAYHGVFDAQRIESLQSLESERNPVYSEVLVTAVTISLWGICAEKSGNDFILEDNAGGAPCIRCVKMELRSPNVIQVYTEAFDQSRCFVNIADARSTCPTAEAIRSGNVEEITLYRKNGFTETGESTVKNTFCPISGQFEFMFRATKVAGSRNSVNRLGRPGGVTVDECNRPSSLVANCPYGFGLTFEYRDCSFPNKQQSYQCLGDWKAPDGESRYFALMDMGAAMDGSRPRYRCGMYREDRQTGTVTMSMAADSNCRHRLRSPQDGAETWMLNPVIEAPLPSLLQEASCEFPLWVRGKWEDVEFGANEFRFRERGDFHTYKATCVSEYLAETGDEEKFHVFARSQCGEEMYSCLWLKKRGINVMEFQLSHPSKVMNWSACSEDYPGSGVQWSTQGRVEVFEESPCPITGEYTGLIPDASGLCARLFSDCENPESMHYKVYNCYNASDIYEDRRYKCLGQWEENGVMYTYTQRTDVPGHECFVGRIINDQELFIQEAGVNCQRPSDVAMAQGMKLLKKASCYARRPPLSTIPQPPQVPVPIQPRRRPSLNRPLWTNTITQHPPAPPPIYRTTRPPPPWNPVHAVAESDAASCRGAAILLVFSTVMSVIFTKIAR